MEIKVNIKPLSANAAWQGRRFKTDAYHAFESMMLLMLPKEKMILGPVSVHFDFYLKNALRTDVDNCIKTSLDCLVKRGYIEDDRRVFKISAEKHKAEDDSISIVISPCG